MLIALHAHFLGVCSINVVSSLIGSRLEAASNRTIVLSVHVANWLGDLDSGGSRAPISILDAIPFLVPLGLGAGGAFPGCCRDFLRLRLLINLFALLSHWRLKALSWNECRGEAGEAEPLVVGLHCVRGHRESGKVVFWVTLLLGDVEGVI